MWKTTQTIITKRTLLIGCVLFVSQMSYPQSQNIDTIPETQELNEVVVTGRHGIGRDKIGRMSISGLEINKQPTLFGERDLIKAIQTTSGVVSGTEGFAGLYVRGGETDQNLYLLDGLPLLNVYHFGGLFSTFSSHSVDRVDFFKGFFPPQFGGRASSVVNVMAKKPELFKTKGILSLGLISGQAYVSTPLSKGKSGVSMAFRRTWLDAISAPALAILNATKKSEGTKNIFNYNFTDAQIKFYVTDNLHNDMSLLLFYGKDNFKLGNEKFNPDNSKEIFDRDLNNMSWGNWGASLDYRFKTPRFELSVQPYVSKAFSSDVQENLIVEKEFGKSVSKTELNPCVIQFGAKEIARIPILTHLICQGGLQQTYYSYRIGNPKSNLNDNKEIQDLPNFSNNWLLSGFGEVNFSITNLGQAIVGTRVNCYIADGIRHWDWEPRCEVTASLPHSSSFSMGYSRIFQYAQQVSSNYIYLPSDAWLPTASHAAPLKCDILYLGYHKPFSTYFNLKTEIWWKEMNSLADFKPHMSSVTSSLPWYDKLTYGKGWAYGLDMELNGRYKTLEWTLAYGLMWNWRKFKDINIGLRFPAKFDNRHKIDVGLDWKINGRLELSGQWEFMTGNKTTLALYNIAPPDVAFPDAPFVNPLDPNGQRQDGIDFLGNRNNVALPAFHRLNLNLSLTGRLGKKLSYQWDFGLYNAYCRMNPFTVVKSYVNTSGNNHGDYRKFKTLSLLPILPSVSYTIKF